MTAKPWLSVISTLTAARLPGISLIRIPIFAEYRPRSKAGNLAQGGCTLEGLRDSGSSLHR